MQALYWSQVPELGAMSKTGKIMITYTEVLKWHTEKIRRKVNARFSARALVTYRTTIAYKGRINTSVGMYKFDSQTWNWPSSNRLIVQSVQCILKYWWGFPEALRGSGDVSQRTDIKVYYICAHCSESSLISQRLQGLPSKLLGKVLIWSLNYCLYLIYWPGH